MKKSAAGGGGDRRHERGHEQAREDQNTSGERRPAQRCEATPEETTIVEEMGGETPKAVSRISLDALDVRGTFSKDRRVRGRSDFLRIQRVGSKVRTTHFVVVAMKRLGGGPARLGMAVSRKAGIAVFRNRLRRLLREVFRRSRAVEREGEGFDFIVIAGERARDLTTPRLSDVAEEVLPALRTARLRAVDRQRVKESDVRKKPAPSRGSGKEFDA